MGSMRKRNRPVNVTLRLEKPRSLTQLDELMDLGLERVDLGREILELTFASTPSDAAGHYKQHLIAACIDNGLVVLDPHAKPAGPQADEEDELLDIRAW
jgi:hypothetical protein